REWDVQMLGIEEAVAEANREVDAIRQRLEGRLDELGIPDHARPRLSGVALYAQRSADRDFRNDLRKQITTEVDAGAKAAKVQIETEKLNVTEQLVVRSLDTREARELIESLPSADSLLPSVDTSALVQRALEAGGRR
ncbi:MAG: hypothetical protein M1337_04080, partial [Actinobacteria bacterium]|nr:hypothetical protein [Actinomycetota bacterium]